MRPVLSLLLALARLLPLKCTAEVWNFGFSQFGVNVAAANASVNAGDPHHFNQTGTNVWQWAGFRYVYMLTHIGSIFEGAFGAGSVGRNKRVRPVYAWQQGDFQEQGIRCECRLVS